MLRPNPLLVCIWNHVYLGGCIFLESSVIARPSFGTPTNQPPKSSHQDDESPVADSNNLLQATCQLIIEIPSVSGGKLLPDFHFGTSNFIRARQTEREGQLCQIPHPTLTEPPLQQQWTHCLSERRSGLGTERRTR
jgi:hypothetical protein